MSSTLADLIVHFGLVGAHPDSASIVGLDIAHGLIENGYTEDDSFAIGAIEAAVREEAEDLEEDDDWASMVRGTAFTFLAVLQSDAKRAAEAKIISEASLRKRVGITSDSEQTSPRATAVKLVSSVMAMMRHGLHYSELVDRAAISLSPEVKEGLTGNQSYQDIVFGYVAGMLDILTTQEAA